MRKVTKVLLYSGGSDSWLISRLYHPDHLVYVDMHTRYSEEEKKRLPSNVTVVDFPLGQWERGDAIIPLRNLYLLMVICNTFPQGDLDICLGATAGDRVLDKTPEFATKAADLLTFLYQPQHWIPMGRHVTVNVTYKKWTKTQMLKKWLDAEAGTDEAKRKRLLKKAWGSSYSCYNPDEHGKECFHCKPCFRKFVAFAMNGMKFTHRDADKVCGYIDEEIMPKIRTGLYGRAEEEKEVKTVVAMWKRGELYEAAHSKRSSGR